MINWISQDWALHNTEFKGKLLKCWVRRPKRNFRQVHRINLICRFIEWLLKVRLLQSDPSKAGELHSLTYTVASSIQSVQRDKVFHVAGSQRTHTHTHTLVLGNTVTCSTHHIAKAFSAVSITVYAQPLKRTTAAFL